MKDFFIDYYAIPGDFLLDPKLSNNLFELSEREAYLLRITISHRLGGRHKHSIPTFERHWYKNLILSGKYSYDDSYIRNKYQEWEQANESDFDLVNTIDGHDAKIIEQGVIEFGGEEDPISVTKARLKKTIKTTPRYLGNAFAAFEEIKEHITKVCYLISETTINNNVSTGVMIFAFIEDKYILNFTSSPYVHSAKFKIKNNNSIEIRYASTLTYSSIRGETRAAPISQIKQFKRETLADVVGLREYLNEIGHRNLIKSLNKNYMSDSLKELVEVA